MPIEPVADARRPAVPERDALLQPDALARVAARLGDLAQLEHRLAAACQAAAAQVGPGDLRAELEQLADLRRRSGWHLALWRQGLVGEPLSSRALAARAEPIPPCGGAEALRRLAEELATLQRRYRALITDPALGDLPRLGWRLKENFAAGRGQQAWLASRARALEPPPE